MFKDAGTVTTPEQVEPDSPEKSESHQEEITTIRKSNKDLERQLDCIVAQFNQFEEELHQRTGRPPKLVKTDAAANATNTVTTSTALDAYTAQGGDPILVTAAFNSRRNTRISTDRLHSPSVTDHTQTNNNLLHDGNGSVAIGANRRSVKLTPAGLKPKRPSTSILKRNQQQHSNNSNPH